MERRKLGDGTDVLPYIFSMAPMCFHTFFPGPRVFCAGFLCGFFVFFLKVCGGVVGVRFK